MTRRPTSKHVPRVKTAHGVAKTSHGVFKTTYGTAKTKHVVSKSMRGAFKRKTSTRAVVAPPAGFHQDHRGSGLFLPVSRQTVVPPSSAKKGFAEARKRIDEALEVLAGSLADGFEVGEIEVQVSFSADGKFLGFGVGGAFSMTLKLRPHVED
jgi:hypothetical protein